MRPFHRKVALLFLLPLAWFAATGTLLVIGQSWRDRSYPYRVPPNLVRASEERKPALSVMGPLVSEVVAQGRFRELQGIHFGASKTESDQIILKGGETWFAGGPGDAIFARKEKGNRDFVTTLTALHRGKILGAWGRALFSILALGLVVFAFSGLWIFQSRWRFGSAREVHRMVGGLVGIPLILTLITGATWNFSQELRGKVPLQAARNQEGRALTAVLQPEDWIRSLKTAQQADETSEPEGMYLTQGTLLVIFRDSTRVYVDPVSTSTEIYRPWSFRGWVEPFLDIHRGTIWGSYGSLVPFLIGLAALAMAVTGCVLDLKRRFRKGW